jgi:hypothetical protein
VLRKARQLGLHGALARDPRAKRVLQLLAALPLLPADQFGHGVQVAQNEMNTIDDLSNAESVSRSNLICINEPHSLKNQKLGFNAIS